MFGPTQNLNDFRLSLLYILVLYRRTLIVGAFCSLPIGAIVVPLLFCVDASMFVAVLLRNTDWIPSCSLQEWKVETQSRREQ